MNLPQQQGTSMELARRALPWLLIAVLWLLNANYFGLEHDAVLYTFQALAHRSPELFSSDIFLKFGSQDRFTLFTPGYSALIAWLGMERAAMVATLLCQAALLFAAWRLVRRLVSPTLALAGFACLVALPNDYGPRRIFCVIENFVTPRMLAEALVVFALLALLQRRRLLAIALLFVGTLLHPLMAAPGFVMAVFLWQPQVPPRWLYAAAILGLALVAAAGSLSALDAWRVDADWRTAIDVHADYLFLQNWEPHDWSRVACGLLTVTLAACFQADLPVRQLCLAALFTAGAGLSLALISVDWLHLAVFMQGQPYRWLWPVSLMAPLLLPAVSIALWQRNEAGRATALTLAASWIMRVEPVAPAFLAVAALFALLSWYGTGDARIRRWLPLGGALLLAIAATYSFASNVLTNAAVYEEGHAPEALNRLRSFCVDGLVPALLILGVLRLYHARRRAAAAAGAALLLGAALFLLPFTAQAWSYRSFDDAVVGTFDEWRKLIPPRTDVAWVEAPMANWYVLQRPSYFSGQQSGSVVFSRAAALETIRRERELIPLLLGTGLSNQQNRGVLRLAGPHARAARNLAEACAQTRVRYLVSRADLHAIPLATAPHDAPTGFKALRLYRCDVPDTAQ